MPSTATTGVRMEALELKTDTKCRLAELVADIQALSAEREFETRGCCQVEPAAGFDPCENRSILKRLVGR